MDALSTALSSVRMTGAIFFDAVFTAPWGFRGAARSARLLQMLAPGIERIVIFHLITQGKAVARSEGMRTIPARVRRHR